MQLSQLPQRFTMPFGKNAGGTYKRAIPSDSQIGIVDGAASLNDGFPPLTFFPDGAPDGRDFNGILHMISAWSWWASSGATVPWDGAFALAVGGYPQGAVVASPSMPGTYYFCTVDNNGTNPDTGGAGWVPFSFKNPAVAVAISFFTSSTTWTPNPLSSRAIAFVWGGGASGQPRAIVDGYGQSGSGGASGGLAISLINTVGLAPQAFTAGAGGAQPSSSGYPVGNSGGTSSLGSLLSASGGVGGASTNWVSGAPGVGLTGDILIRGNPSMPGAFVSGAGGPSPFLGGAGRGQLSTDDAATGRGRYGGGGGGGHHTEATPIGWAGGDGCALIIELR